MLPNQRHLVAIMVLAGCVAAPEQPPAPVHMAATPQPAAPPPASLAWPAMAECRELATALAAIPAAEHRRLDPAEAPLGATIRVADGADPASDLTGDLPLPLPRIRRRRAGADARSASASRNVRSPRPTECPRWYFLVRLSTRMASFMG